MKQLKIPIIFYGTAWKKDKTADYVALALKSGFRAIDTACQPKHYNEYGVGQGIQKSGVPRNQLFIQTKFTPVDGQDPNKIPYDPKAEITDQVKKSLEVSLYNLKTNYIDSLVLHSPLKTLQNTMKVWKTFQQFVKEGKVHYLGISNCYDLKLFKNIYDKASIKPSFLQNRFYSDSGYDKQLRKFCDSNGIKYQSFWTLTANPHILGSSYVKSLSQKYNKTPAQVFFKFVTQINIIPLTGTTSPQHMKQDLEIFQLEITKQEIKSLLNFLE